MSTDPAVRILRFKHKNKWGYINAKGEEVIPPKYNTAFDFKNGTAIVKQNNYYGLIDKQDNPLLSFEYEMIEPCINGVRKAKKDGKYVLLDNFGQIMI